MKTADIFTLVGAKFKIRKLRATVTIITASALFGVIIAVLLIAMGYFTGLIETAKKAFGDDVILAVHHQTTGFDTPAIREMAVKLYEASDDESKQYPIITLDPVDGMIIPPYLDAHNPFAITAATLLGPQQIETSKDTVARLIEPYDGKVIGTIDHYCITNPLFIERLTPPEYAGMMTCAGNVPGEAVIVVNSDTLNSLIRVSQQKDEVIQIIMPLEQAAKIIGVTTPSYYHPNPAASLKDFINTVNQQAVGRQFTGDLTIDDTAIKLTYEIVGLLPPSGISTLDPRSINPLQTVISSMIGGNEWNNSFIVTNPRSSTFKDAYRPHMSRYGIDILASFPDPKKAAYFHGKDKEIGSTEFIGNQLSLRATSNDIDRIIVASATIFSIVAIVIMAGTVSRTIDDERQTIALYRAVGATTKNILQVFASYVFTLSLLIIACSAIIGLALSWITTATNTALITAHVSARYNVPDLPPIIFVGYDPRIFIIFAIIVAIGLTCLLLVLDKLTSKSIIRDLRK